MGLKGNVAARKAAEEVFELAIGESKRGVTGDGSMMRFWGELRGLIDEVIPSAKPESPKGSISPMTHKESKAFGQREMPWGVHQGQKVDDIEQGYLEYVSEEDGFKAELRRYLRSERITGED